MGDFFEFDWGGGGDEGWMDTSYDVPDYSMSYDFAQPVGGYDQYLPDFSLGGGGYQSIAPPPGALEQLGATHYDPSTNTYFNRAGNPIQAQGGGDVQQGTGMTYDAINNRWLNANGEPAGGGTAGAVLGGVAGAAGAAGRLVAGGGGGGTGRGGGDGWGSLLAQLGVGGAALGLGRLMAGDAPKAPKLTLPGQSPTTSATEGALFDALNQGGRADLTRAAGNSIAGQADLSALLRQMVGQEQTTETQMQPGFGDARMKALGLIPGQLDTSMDPVQTALQAELMKTMEGHSNPVIEDQIRKDWAAFQNQMFKRLGPDWELSSAGQESKQAFDRSAEQRRFTSRQDTISRLQPLQANQGQVVGGERRANAASLASATNLGRSDPFRVGTQMNTIAPVGAYLGGDPDRFRAVQAQLESQSALLPYNQANKERSETMAGVGALGGTIAGSIGKRSLSDYAF